MVNTLERVFTPDFVIHTITMHSSLMHGWNKARSAFGMDNRTSNYSLFSPKDISSFTGNCREDSFFYYTEKRPLFFYFILTYFRHSATKSLNFLKLQGNS